jgi:hypothetical protein
MGKYTCPETGCNYVKETGRLDRDVAHEREHRKNTTEVEKIEKVKCEKCDGLGYTENRYIVDEDVPKTD